MTLKEGVSYIAVLVSFVNLCYDMGIMTIYTIGHSTHPIEEFIELLQSRAITLLVDVRTIPKSGHNPQFMQDALKDSLRQAAIQYVYMKNLGGLRSKQKESINTAWHNPSFRNYADYMQTREFVHAIRELMDRAIGERAVIMCAEAVPWRCHRSLIGDALLVRGVRVIDILSLTSERPHTLTRFAKVEKTHITYPKECLSEGA